MLRKLIVLLLILVMIGCGGEESVKVSLLSPEDGMYIEDSYVTLQWKGEGADKYDLFLNSDGEFRIVARDIEATSFTVGPLSPGLYLWKVRAKGEDSTSDSSVYAFVVRQSSVSLTTPELLTPPYGVKVSGSVVEFSWSAVTGDTDIAYKLLVGDSPDHLEVVADSLASTSYVYDVPLDSERIWWQVVAYSENGGESFSDKWFYYSGLATNVDQPPSVPDLVSPANGLVSYRSAILLRWKRSVDPEGKQVKYNIYLGESPDSLRQIVQGYDRNVYILSGLEEDSVYYWRVEAVDVVGNVTRSGESWFYVRPFSTVEKIVKVEVPRGEEGKGCVVTNYGRLICWSWEKELGAVPFSPDFHIEDVSVTNGRTFAIDNLGNLWGWGKGDYFAIGNGMDEDLSSPAAIKNSENVPWYMVSAGKRHTCGIDVNGALWCWGDNSYGEAGKGEDFVVAVTPFKFYWFTDGIWMNVSAGDDFTCGIYFVDDTSKLYCWGDNGRGEIGVPGSDKYYQPVEVKNPHGRDWISVSAAGKHVCAIDDEHNLWCWGDNTRSQIGIPRDLTPSGFQDVPRMMMVGGVPGWKAVFTTEGATCGYDLDDGLWCWGYNGDDNSGDSFGRLMVRVDQLDYPERVSTNVEIRDLSMGYRNTCMLNDNYGLFCWGDRSNNAMGDAPRGFSDFTYSWNGRDFNADLLLPLPDGTCVSSGEGLTCWGENGSGEFASGTTESSIFPETTYTGRVWKKLSIPKTSPDGNFVCGIDVNDDLYCWGRNDHGQLGVGDTEDRYQPVKVQYPSGLTWVQVGTGFAHTCALDGNGDVWCWGDNSYQQLGTDSVTQSLLPYRVVTDTAFKSVAVGGNFTCAVNVNGKVLCWGSNRYGENGSRYPCSPFLPHIVRGKDIDGQEMVEVVAGDYNACVLDSNHQIYCWGTYESNPWLSCYDYGDIDQYGVFGVLWQGLKASDRVTCGIDQFDSIRCWGDGSNLVLGGDLPILDSSGIEASFVVVRNDVDPDSWELGANTICIKNNGKVLCRGDVRYTGNRLKMSPYMPEWAEDISSLQ